MYEVKCPQCNASIQFTTRKGLKTASMSKELSLFLHGKTMECGSCGAIVKLKRRKDTVITYGVDVKYEVPLFDKAGNHVANAKPEAGSERMAISDVR